MQVYKAFFLSLFTGGTLLWLLRSALLGYLVVMLLKALLVSEVIYDSL